MNIQKITRNPNFVNPMQAVNGKDLQASRPTVFSPTEPLIQKEFDQRYFTDFAKFERELKEV